MPKNIMFIGLTDADIENTAVKTITKLEYLNRQRT